MKEFHKKQQTIIRRVDLSESKLAKIREELAELRKLVEDIETPKIPTLSVPFWGWFKSSATPALFLDRIKEADQIHYYIDPVDGGRDDRFWDKRCFHNIATPDDIKEHLIKLAEEKGFVNGARHSGWNGKGDYVINSAMWTYSLDRDSLANGNWTVCCKGKWAVLIKEELPTFGELGAAGISIKMRYLVLEESTRMMKPITLIKLMRVADYVNGDWNGKGKYSCIKLDGSLSASLLMVGNYSMTPVRFRDKKAAEKAIEIFRHNKAEQDLIEFYS